MYPTCVKCEKLGVVCKGPNFMDMTVPELIDWLRERKAHLGWTNATLAAKSNVPIGTVNRLLSGAYADFKYETIRPMLRAITGSSGAELPCPDPSDTISEQLRERCNHLEQELADTKLMAARNDARDADQIAHLKSQANNLRKALSIMTALLIVVLLVIIGVLAYDLTHPGYGYIGR